AAARAHRCQGRVPSRRNRSEPEAHGTTDGGSAHLSGCGAISGIRPQKCPFILQRHKPDSSAAKPPRFSTASTLSGLSGRAEIASCHAIRRRNVGCVYAVSSRRCYRVRLAIGIGTAMTLELKMLALSIVLGLVQIVLASHAASLQRGYVWTASSRDEAAPALTGVAGRLGGAPLKFVGTLSLLFAG